MAHAIRAGFVVARACLSSARSMNPMYAGGTEMQKINDAYERVLKSDVRYRFVIDIASLRG